MTVYSRSDWGAGPHRAGVIRLPVGYYFLHHTVTPFWTGVQAARNLQAIARSRGFADISYTWLTDRQGNEIEGRGWGRQGAHTVGYNSTGHALSLVGNLESTPVPDGMVRGIVRLIRRHRAVGPGRITHPHSAVSSTACPGRYPRARIPEFNRLAAGAPAPTPPPPPRPPTPLERLRMAVSDERFDTMFDRIEGLHLGRQHKTYGRDYIKAAVEPALEEIRKEVTDDSEGADTLATRVRHDLLGRDDKLLRPYFYQVRDQVVELDKRVDGLDAKLDQILTLLARET